MHGSFGVGWCPGSDAPNNYGRMTCQACGVHQLSEPKPESEGMSRCERQKAAVRETRPGLWGIKVD
jgi:hypothetical protein